MSKDRRRILHFPQPIARGASILGLCVALGIVAFATLVGPGTTINGGVLADTAGPQLFLARGQ